VRNHRLAQMIVIALVASAAGIAVGLAIDWFPTAASTQAGPIDTLYDVLLIVSVPVAVGVIVVVLFSVWQFHMRPGQEQEDGPPIHGDTRLEVVWTAIPALILVGLCSYAYAVLTDIEKQKTNELQVQVYGQQFAWSYRYTAPDGKAFSSNVLYAPCAPTGGGAACKGQPLHFRIRAVDVIHSFWVPAWRMKQDAVPGITTQVRVTPNRLGTYPLVCTELCGVGHATMRSTVRVVPPGAFQAWLRSKGRTTPGAGTATAAAGAAS